MGDEETKICRLCKIKKSIFEYDLYKKNYDGLYTACKNCLKNYKRDLKRKNPKYSLNQRKSSRNWHSRNDYYQKNRDYYIARRKKYIKEKPEYIEAQQKAQKNVPITVPCYFCDSDDNLIRHHHDYRKPLDITILCRSCHSKYHFLFKLQVNSIPPSKEG